VRKSVKSAMKNEPEKLAADLDRVLQGDVFVDIIRRVAYSTDASMYRILPQYVVAPRDHGDIVAVVRYARAKGIPVAARGAATGVAGESLCSGIVFDMTRYMNKIIRVENKGAAVVCEPGVVLDDLNNCLAEYGRIIGPDPSSSSRATVGGCVANNATGPHSLQYGHMAGYVASIEAVLADGSLVEFHNDVDPEEMETEPLASIAKQCFSLLSENQAIINKALPETQRNRSGYNVAGICHGGKLDLARLLTGSEGTLAVFTRIELKTVPLPPAKALLQLEFDSLQDMSRAVPLIVDTGASVCELMDKTLIDMAFEALPEYHDVLPADAAAVLMVEHTGQTEREVKNKIEKTDAAVGRLAGARSTFFGETEQARLWKLRKDAGPLLYRKKGKHHPVEFVEDVSVRNDRLGEYISGLKKMGQKYDMAMSFFGHAGDGELHIRPFINLSDPAEVQKMRAVADEVFELAWSLGGSISGEHADGLVRAAFVKRQYGDKYYDVLCKIKNIFDPDGLMNPGKIINSDPDVMVKNIKAAQGLSPERLKTDLLFDEDEIEFELEQCYGCGLCLSRESDLRMCPVFRALGEELGSSRAKINVLHYWATGQLKEEDFRSPQFRRFLDLCINCKACLLQCPSGVDISKLMITARAQYVKCKGLGRAERLLSHNRHLSILGSTFVPISNLAMRLPVVRWLLEKVGKLDRRRDMPKFARRSFLKVGRKYLTRLEPISKPVDRVAYFVDTYVNYNDHDLGFAVLDVLRHNNIKVILPKQRPAPLPAIVYGDVKTARKDLSYSVKHLAQAVRDGYKVVCSEPSAALCLKQELRHFVAGEDAKLVSENTYELMNYLLSLLSQGSLETAAKQISQEYVYHMPCHLAAVGDGQASIKLLRELCGLNVTDLKAGCCGLAGTFGMQEKNYELSSQIGASLKEALEKSPIKNVLTECSACKMQIEHIGAVPARHPIKILAQAYSLL
jgi:anaerobic glycerol-3-phosphate dehydrogenase C subunit